MGTINKENPDDSNIRASVRLNSKEMVNVDVRVGGVSTKGYKGNSSVSVGSCVSSTNTKAYKTESFVGVSVHVSSMYVKEYKVGSSVDEGVRVSSTDTKVPKTYDSKEVIQDLMSVSQNLLWGVTGNILSDHNSIVWFFVLCFTTFILPQVLQKVYK